MPSRIASVTNKEISQLIKRALPEIHEVLTGKALFFYLNLSIKPVKKFFVYKCKLSVSLALLYLVEKRSSQLLLKKFPRKSETDAVKILFELICDDHGRSVIVRQNCNRWQQ